MFSYRRKVFYVETDKMGIVHHSNYIRWMEEARVEFLNAIGLPFTEIESIGIVSPVVSISVEYKYPCAFGDEVEVRTKMTKYTGVRYEVSYEIYNLTQRQLSATATSKHCFTSENRVCSLKKADASMHEKLADTVEAPESE